MKILDVLTAPWAIVPEKLEEIRGIYATHLRGEKIDIAGIEARLGKPLQNEPQGYDVYDGVAVIPVVGVIAKRMNLFSQISGGASTELIARDLREAVNDPSVKAIILQVDSPGGTVDGTQALAQAVMSASEKKPVVTYADGMMASAAYWIGSAASQIYIDGDTTQVGSIGVVATHRDVSRAEESAGVKTTEIYAGKYKRIATQYAPLTEDGRKSIQDQVDYLYEIFVDNVAQQRGVSVDTVLAEMADGRVFTGKQAIAAGLVDGVSTLDQLIADLAAGMQPRKRIAAAGAAVDPQNLNTMEGNEMVPTKQSIETQHPDIAKALREEGFAAGAAAERQRILDVEANGMPGHEALIAKLKADGKTTGPEAAVQVLQAEKAKGANRLSMLKEDAPAVVPPTVATNAPAADALPFDERVKAKWEQDANLRAEFGGSSESYVAYEKAAAGGRIKVLGKKA